jgi:hypothetical protein
VTNPRPAYRFPKGASGNPKGHSEERRNWTPSKTAQYWDLKRAMREMCPEATEVVRKCLKSEDERIALTAAQIAFERGFGKPEVHADVTLMCNFAEVPAVMPLGQWLERKGQPEGDDRWLLEHQAKQGPGGVAAPQEKRSTGAPADAAGASGGPPTIDLQAEDPLLTAVDPTEPRPPGSKLN